MPLDRVGVEIIIKMNRINVVFSNDLHDHFDNMISYLWKTGIEEKFIVIWTGVLRVNGRKIMWIKFIKSVITYPEWIKPGM